MLSALVNPLLLIMAAFVVVAIIAWLSVSGEIHKENMRTISGPRRESHHR
jgi:hypothetical protein